MNQLPRIALLTGPGTLPSRGRDRLDLVRYRRSGHPQMSGAELLEGVPEVGSVARVEVHPGNPHGIATPEDLRRLALRLNQVLDGAGTHGAVFVQGTNSIEETAFFLNLTVKSAKPVVVTGAQRPFTAISTDAHLNLLDAFRVAASPDSHARGVLVVANGEINAAREVTKTNTYHLQTFRSRDLGLLGYADADRVIYYRSPLRRHTLGTEFDVGASAGLPRVDILYVSVSSQPGLAQAALALGARGIVAAASGGGSCGNLEAELAQIAASGRALVVRASRVGEGRVLAEDGWQQPGMIAADNLSPHKAALLLALALTRTTDTAAVQRMFEEY